LFCELVPCDSSITSDDLKPHEENLANSPLRIGSSNMARGGQLAPHARSNLVTSDLCRREIKTFSSLVDTKSCWSRARLPGQGTSRPCWRARRWDVRSDNIVETSSSDYIMQRVRQAAIDENCSCAVGETERYKLIICCTVPL
jgi:hypothetical protein